MNKYTKIGKGLVVGLLLSASVASNAYYENKFYQIRNIQKSVLCDNIDVMSRSALKLCEIGSVSQWHACIELTYFAKENLGLCHNNKKMRKAKNAKIQYVIDDYVKNMDAN